MQKSAQAVFELVEARTGGTSFSARFDTTRTVNKYCLLRSSSFLSHDLLQARDSPMHNARAR